MIRAGRKLREVDFLAAAAILIVAGLGYYVRNMLSPDGVSYLDLSEAFRRGDWHHFVQGYWSPLLPALLGVLGGVSGLTGHAFLPIAHAVNVLVVVCTVFVLWRWSRIASSPWFGRAAFAALIVSGTEPPRVEAVTPDLILMLVLVTIAYELVVHRGSRWLWLGVLFGLAFLTKTSSWPWLLIATGLRIWLARDAAERRPVMRSHAAMCAVMLCWIIPMSVTSGHPTLGATGTLNYTWYIESSDARTPDSHWGNHRQYHPIPGVGGSTAQWARFDQAARWTYEPWSDPQTWSHGVLSRDVRPPTLPKLITYWRKGLWLTLSIWLQSLILFVIIPVLWIGRRRWRWRTLRNDHPNAMLLAILGVLGIAQFIAVHAEPRLIAPYALLGALGVLAVALGEAESTTESAPIEIPRTLDRRVLSILGLVVAAFVAGRRLHNAAADNARISEGLRALEAMNRAAFAPRPADAVNGLSQMPVGTPEHPRVVVIGPVIPVLANIYWTGGWVVAQIPPHSRPALDGLDRGVRRQLLHDMFAGHADVLWVTKGDGTIEIDPVP